MKIYIVGAGAIGVWFGDQLHAIGCEIHYAPRDLAAVVPVEAELAVIAVKAFDTPGAIATLERALAQAPQTTILCLQNGVGNEEQFAAAFGADRIVAGALTIPVERRADGSVASANRGGIGIAPWGRQAHNWLIALLNQLGLPLVIAPSAQRLKWSKLALNCVTNASAAILDMSPAEIVADKALFAVECDALREIRRVMHALDFAPLDLPRYPVRALLWASTLPTVAARAVLAERIGRARGDKSPSLLLDVQAGKTHSEVSVLNGAVARAGQMHGIAAPVNAALTRILENIAEHPGSWERFRKRPAAFLAEIRSQRSS